MAHPATIVGRFVRERTAMAAVEFAIIVPVLFAIMLGGIQLVTYANATRRVDLIVRSISQMISQAQPPSGSSIATVAAADLHFAYDSALVTFPYVMADSLQKGIPWWQDIVINFASIQFNQISTTCPASGDQSPCYVANVVWTSTGVNSSNYRPCIVPQAPVNDLNPPSPTTLPRSLYGPTSIIVVDVSFMFKPTFGSSFLPQITIARTAYIQPRYATLINYDTTNNDGIASRCPGY